MDVPTKRHILLVEDNPDDIELTKRAFRKVNLLNQLEIVTDGQAALDYLIPPDGSVNHQLPSVVLLDLQLPKVSGVEVLQRLRANPATKTLPVVILTSSKDGNDIARCYEYNCNSYIQKPVAFNDFISAVNNLGMYWLLLNEPPAL